MRRIFKGNPKEENYMIARVSPAYQSSNLFENPTLLISGVIGILLIIVIGYSVYLIASIGDTVPAILAGFCTLIKTVKTANAAAPRLSIIFFRYP